jgi:anti-anti-sigma factor
MTFDVVPPSARAVRIVRPALTILVRRAGIRTVVVLRGEADLSTMSILSDALSRVVALGAGDVVVDLVETEFIDCGSVRSFAVCRRLMDGQGRKLTFRSPSRLAALVLAAFGLGDLITTQNPLPAFGRAHRPGGVLESAPV